MSDPRGMDDMVASWLQSEAVGRAPDRVFETVFTATRARGQAGAWQWWVDAVRAGLLGRTAGRVVLVAVAMAIATGALLAGASLLNRPQPTPRPARSVAATVLATTCAHPSAVVVVSDSAWVTCQEQIRRFDAATGRVTAAVVASVVAVDAAGAWAATGAQVESLDGSGIPSDRLPIKGASALALDPDSLWVAEAISRSVIRIDRTSHAVIGSIDVGGAPSAVAADGRFVWVALATEHRLVRIDPATDLVAGPFDVPAADAVQLAGSRVWVLDAGPGIVYAIDPATGGIDLRVVLPQPPSTLVTGGPAAWTGLTADGDSLLAAGGSRVVRIDTSSGEILDRLDITEPQSVSLGGAAETASGLVVIDTQGQRLLAVVP